MAAATPAVTADGARLYREECGSCHVAYPPRALPQASWRAIMRTLDQHFGTDASLDAVPAAAITAWLDGNAGRNRHAERDRGEARDSVDARDRVVLRITQTPWFRHEHHEIGADVWKRPSVRGPANCEACHAGAASGRFSEHDVRIPR